MEENDLCAHVHFVCQLATTLNNNNKQQTNSFLALPTHSTHF